MKKFHFPLSRVIDYRETLERAEEAKLQDLYAELRAIEAQEAELKNERARSEAAVRAAKTATGSELAALDAFRRYAVAEHTRLEQKRADCMKRIGSQIQVVTQKRRDVRLLENLRAARMLEWKREADREIDMHAEEAYLSKWNRAR